MYEYMHRVPQPSTVYMIEREDYLDIGYFPELYSLIKQVTVRPPVRRSGTPATSFGLLLS